LAGDALQQILNLLAHVANLNDRVVRLAQLVANLQPQLELLRIVRRRGRQTRIGFDLEVLRQGLAVDRELHLISSGRRFWTTRFARPQNHSRKTHRIRISRVPNETIQPNFGRHRRRSAATKPTTLTRRRPRWRSRRPPFPPPLP